MLHLFQHQILRIGVRRVPNGIRENLKVLLNTLESFLVYSKWFAGDELTLADFALLASVESIKVIRRSLSGHKTNLIDSM